MYPCYRDGIRAGRESFPIHWIIAENLLYVIMWALAAALLWPLWLPGGIPVLTLAWILILLVAQILLKKHNCSGCYYYGKWCHLGWGRLAALMFRPDSGSFETGKRLALIYIVPPPLILVATITNNLLRGASLASWLTLAAYVLVNAASFPIRKKGCSECSMRGVCPGSAAKDA